MARHVARTVTLEVAAIAMVLVGCGDLVLGERPRVDLEPSPGVVYLDFGQVEAGDTATRVFEVVNRGREPAAFEPVPPESPWSWDLALAEGQRVTLQGGGALAEPVGLSVAFDFAPGIRPDGQYSGEARLVGDQVEYEIRLVGRVINDPIVCSTEMPESPTALSFGSVVIGEERTKLVHCTNRSERSRRIRVSAPQEVGNRFVVDPKGLELVIQAGGRGTIPIRFLAGAPAGEVEAFLPIGAIADEGGVDREVGYIELTGQVVPTHVVTQDDGSPIPPTLDFGFVPMGKSAEFTLALRNLYDREVSIAAEWPSGSNSDFALVELPETLGPADSETGKGSLRVRFSPAFPGDRRDRLVIRVQRDDSKGLVEDVVFVQGFGGGPEVSCAPEVLHFGQVAVGAKVVGTIECRNVGDDLPASDRDDLEFVEVRGGGEVFSFLPSVLVQDGSQRIEVTYRPNAPGVDHETLEVVTCAGVGCAGDVRLPRQDTLVRLTGDAKFVAPEAYCDAAFEPAELDYGRLDREAGEARLTARLVNRGAHECLVSAMDFEPGASPGFEVRDRPAEPWILAPGATLPIQVVFRPAADGEAKATARVWISNPERPGLALPVRANVGGSCLAFEPPSVDFTEGTERKVDPALSCGAPDVAVKVRNGCSGTWQVTGFAPAAGSASGFSVSAPGAVPASLPQGASHGFAVDFRPAEEGIFYGGIDVFVRGPDGTEEALFLPVVGEAATGGRWFDRIDLVKPKLDLLVVLTSSPAVQGRSIVSELVSQTRIAEMTRVLGRPDLDWQLGITSTDLDAPDSVSCEGGTNGGEAGRLVPVPGTDRRILAAGFGFETDFAAIATSVLPCSVAERAFDAVVLAVSEPLASTANHGFARDGGHLAVVFISARDDASERSASGMIDVLRVRKAPGLFSAWAILGDPAADCASPGVGARYAEAVQLTRRETFLACEPETWGSLWAAAGTLASRSQSTYRLSMPTTGVRDSTQLTQVMPNGTSIRVRDGWQYLSDRQTIEFSVGRMLALFEVGGRIEVAYPLVCED